MRHQFGWDLPAGVTQQMIDDHYGGPDHHEDCPCHEGQPTRCANCGGDLDCEGGVCWVQEYAGWFIPEGVSRRWDRLVRWIAGTIYARGRHDEYCQPERDPECRCAEIKEDSEPDWDAIREAREEARRGW